MCGRWKGEGSSLLAALAALAATVAAAATMAGYEEIDFDVWGHEREEAFVASLVERKQFAKKRARADAKRERATTSAERKREYQGVYQTIQLGSRVCMYPAVKNVYSH